MKKYFVILVALMAGTTGIFAQFAISPVKMNVLYLGIDNPLSISVSGVPDEKVSVEISQGTLNKVSGNEYIAKPTTPGNARIEVSYEIDGQKMAGIMEFRVKMLPVPTAKLAGKSGGNIEKTVLLAQKGVIADLDDFLFDLRYDVTQFTVVSISQGVEKRLISETAIFTAEQKELLTSLNKGQRVFLTDIKARGRGFDSVINLRDLVFTID